MSTDLEELKAVYFDRDAIREAPRRLFRRDIDGRRFYITDPEGAERCRLYPSVTTVISATTPMSPFLLKWIVENGQKGAERLRDQRAAYGTLMHIILAEFVIAGTIDLDAMDSVVEQQRVSKGWSWDTLGWADDLRQDVLGFATFWQEKQAKAVAIEMPLASDDLGYAGALDLVVDMDVERGQGRGRAKLISRETCYLDWKSNRVAFYEESVIQGHAYVALWNERFPEKPITSVFLYGCKDWDATSRDRYRLKNTTEDPMRGVFPSLLEQFKARNQKQRTSLRLTGRVSLTTSNERCIVEEPIEVALANSFAKRAKEVTP